MNAWIVNEFVLFPLKVILKSLLPHWPKLTHVLMKCMLWVLFSTIFCKVYFYAEYQKSRYVRESPLAHAMDTACAYNSTRAKGKAETLLISIIMGTHMNLTGVTLHDHAYNFALPHISTFTLWKDWESLWNNTSCLSYIPTFKLWNPTLGTIDSHEWEWIFPLMVYSTLGTTDSQCS